MEILLWALKWISQALIVVVGTWGIFSDPYETDSNDKRRLTRSGRTKIILLGIGFIVFVLTDINEREMATEEAARQREQLATQRELIENQRTQLDTQKTQLSYTQQLLLTQHQLSELSISLEFDESLWGEFVNVVMAYVPDSKSNATEPDQTILAYVANGTTRVRYPDNGFGYLEYSLSRPQGLVGGRIDSSRPEYLAYIAALRWIFGHRFEIRSDTGRILIDPLEPEREMAIDWRRTKSITLALPDPGVRFDEIQGDLSIVMGNRELLYTGEPEYQEASPSEQAEDPANLARPDVGPVSIRLTSLDPRVDWNQTLVLDWRPEVTDEEFDPDYEIVRYFGEWHAGPYAVEARFVE